MVYLRKWIDLEEYSHDCALQLTALKKFLREINIINFISPYGRNLLSIMVAMKSTIIALGIFFLTSCGSGEKTAEQKFIEYCRDFRFVGDGDVRDLGKLRSLIRAGKVDLEREVSFHIISETSKGVLLKREIEDLEILTIEVSAPIGESFNILLLTAKVKNSAVFSISAPEYYDMNCFSVYGETYYDFVERGGVRTD